MNMTARELQEFAGIQLGALCQFPDRSNSDVYAEVAEHSGLSKSLVRDFHGGIRDNLTVDSLDRMVAGIKHAMRKAAA